MKKIFFIILGFTFTNCSKTENKVTDCQKEEHTTVLSVKTDKDEVKIFQDLAMSIEYIVDSPCSSLKRVEGINDTGFVRNIYFINQYKDCDCKSTTKEKAIYKTIFRANKSGTYILNFKNPKGQVVTKKIEVLQQ